MGENSRHLIGDYCPGHPWYYRLGGRPLGPAQIKRVVADSGRFGYRRDEFRKLDQLSEPTRSQQISALKQAVRNELASDLLMYRRFSKALRLERQSTLGAATSGSSNPLHTDLSLKYNHCTHGYAHLKQLAKMERQLDFEF